MHACLCLLITLTLCAAALAAPPRSLLRNGSFEGSTQYWMPVERAGELRVQPESAAHGQYAVRVSNGIRSGAFSVQPGQRLTLRFHARGSADQPISVSFMPGHRDTAQKSGLFTRPAARLRLTSDWSRHAALFTVPKLTGGRAWNGSSWIVSISSESAWSLDGVELVVGGFEQDAYVPWAPVEVVADAPRLSGYESSGNWFAGGESVPLRVALSNHADGPRSVIIRREVLTYDASRVLWAAPEETRQLPGGQTTIDEAPVELRGKGLMLARVTVLDASGQVLDKSDQPLTVLPFPKAAQTPDRRERIGCSMRSEALVPLAQRIGFRWCRWWPGSPNMVWHRAQADGPAKIGWSDETVDLLERHGFAINWVLYQPPDWARAAGNKWKPKDMDWPAGDRRWDDLPLRTAWDEYLRAVVMRYRDRAVAWEMLNEPDIEHRGVEVEHYRELTRRTQRILEELDPDAPFLVNCVHPGPTPFQKQFLSGGGARLFDVYSFHNYGQGALASPADLRQIRKLLDDNSGKDAGIWFNEGWLFVPSSIDYPANEWTRDNAAATADNIVRSVAAAISQGLDKVILFHIGYAPRQRSYWDWTPSGTELWDDVGNPTVGVSVWNVLADQLGLSERIGAVPLQGVQCHVFDDLRNNRGVAVVWSDGAPAELLLKLPGAVVRDIMGNDRTLQAERGHLRVDLPGDGRPIYLFTPDGMTGQRLAQVMRQARIEANGGR
jgi:hypothetical protein